MSGNQQPPSGREVWAATPIVVFGIGLIIFNSWWWAIPTAVFAGRLGYLVWHYLRARRSRFNTVQTG